MNMLISSFNKLCKMGMNDRSDFLKILGVTGMVLGCLAQASGIIFNKNLDRKEKNFLIPQELADGLLNSTLFWFVTSKTSDLGKKLVYTKKIIPKSLEGILRNYTPKGNSIKELEKNFLSHLKHNGSETIKQTGCSVANGVGLLSMILGSILSVNILTPILRNKIAGKIQKNTLQKLDIIENNTNIYTNLPKPDYSKFNKIFLITKNKVCTFNQNLKI